MALSVVSLYSYLYKVIQYIIFKKKSSISNERFKDLKEKNPVKKKKTKTWQIIK
jgi:hypothetical protein